MKHHITKYHTDGQHYATSWFQINLFGKAFCFSKKTIEI